MSAPDEKAAEAFSRDAERYARDGFFLKAIASLKQALKLDPTRGDTRSRLVELHLRAGLVPEATHFYREAVAVEGRAEPSASERMLYFAWVLLDAGRMHEARTELSKVELLLRAETPALADAVAQVLQLEAPEPMREVIEGARRELFARANIEKELRALDFERPN